MPNGQPLSDVVSIAATTAGVTGTITVTSGARLSRLNLSWTQTTAALPQIVELSWAGSPQPLRFVPPAISMIAGTAAGGHAFLLDALGFQIPLDVVVKDATLVTIKVTSSGNLTCKISLEWD